MEQDAQLRGRRSLDFFIGLIFAALGVYIALEGVYALGDKYLATVPRVTNPGITTLVIGGLLALCGASIAIIGFLGSGNPLALAVKRLPEIIKTRHFRKGLLVIALITVYFFVLWDNVPFVVSMPLFLVGMMFAFRAGAWWKILLIAAIATALTYYVFAVLAVVPLPNEFFWVRHARLGK